MNALKICLERCRCQFAQFEVAVTEQERKRGVNWPCYFTLRYLLFRGIRVWSTTLPLNKDLHTSNLFLLIFVFALNYRLLTFIFLILSKRGGYIAWKKQRQTLAKSTNKNEIHITRTPLNFTFHILFDLLLYFLFSLIYVHCLLI